MEDCRDGSRKRLLFLHILRIVYINNLCHDEVDKRLPYKGQTMLGGMSVNWDRLFMLPGIGWIGLALVVMVLLIAFRVQYVNVAPNVALIISGRRR